MFKKSIEAIIADGKKTLESLAHGVESNAFLAKKEISRCSEEIQGLVTLAQQVPEKVFDRYSNVLTAVGEIYGHASGYNTVRIAGTDLQLRGIMGDEAVKPGKYRIVVLVEPIS